MLTPADKIARRGNNIIQVVVTRKCDIFNCSNCTQILPMRHDPWEMSLECAEEALKSLAGWPGIIAMFGGNPCTHSRFEELCRLWQNYVAPNQRGLWTNSLMGKGWVASMTFIEGISTFNLNVHGNERAAAEMRQWFPCTKVYGERPSMHGQVLGFHGDYGVSEADWFLARENCDINQKWSAGIYARSTECPHCVGYGGKEDCPHCHDTYSIQKPFIYFCEVAGAIDGVTGENNGLPATPGWWQRPIEDFEQQISECCDKRCVVPLRLKGSVDDADNYDVSASVVPLTTDRIGKVTVTASDRMETVKELTDYQRLRT